MNHSDFARAVLNRRSFRPAPRRHRKPIPRQLQPNAIRLAYSSALRPLLEKMKQLVDESVVPQLPEFVAIASQVHDAAVGPLNYAEKFSTMLVWTSRELFARFTNEQLRALALQFGQRTSDHQKRQLAAQFIAALGFDPLQSEPWLRPVLKAFAHTNAVLIKSVPERYFAEIEARTLDALRTGERAEDIAKSYQDRYGIAESRARLIARDQIGKLNGQLNVARQRRAGVQKWTWRTSEDERVRPEHEELDGRMFGINDPPGEGYPGEPINCRCTSEPDIQSEIDELGDGGG